MAAGGLWARFRPGLGVVELGNEWRRQRARRGRLSREGFERGGEEMAGATSFARVSSTFFEEGEGDGREEKLPVLAKDKGGARRTRIAGMNDAWRSSPAATASVWASGVAQWCTGEEL